MRKPLVLILAACGLSSPALAQETLVERLLALSREANGECRKAQLPQRALDAACQSGRAYDAALGELGLCLDAESGEWRGCARTGQVAPSFNREEPVAPEPEPEPQQSTEVPEPMEQYVAPGSEAEQPPMNETTQQQEEPSVHDDWSSAEQGEWRTYHNRRFGTVAEIPAWRFQPATQIDEDDGQTFAAEDVDAEIAVYGSLLEGQPFRQYRDWYRSELSGVSYEAGGQNWFVMSGIAEGKIYYVKVMRSERCGVDIAHHAVLRYPSESKREFDPIVKRLAGSLRGATPESYCG